MKLNLGAVVGFFALIGLVATVSGAKESSGSFESLSVRDQQLQSGERVVGFELRLKPIRVVSLRSIPAGWEISVDNDPSWSATVTGSIKVGAAALDDLSLFRECVVIERDDSLETVPEMEGEIVVTRDFVHERRIALRKRDFLVTTVKGGPGNRP